MRTILTLSFTALLMLGMITAIAPMGVGLITGLAWHEELMANSTFDGLIHDSESLVIVYVGTGAWSSSVTDVHNYLIYRESESGILDLQARIELARMGPTTYVMEIYHSVRNGDFSFATPYTHIIKRETNFLTSIEIEEDLTELSIATGYFTDEIPDLGSTATWHEDLMANITFQGLVWYCENNTDITMYIGAGAWNNPETDVQHYLVFRTNDDGDLDLQAHVELAKIDTTTILMEIYHSNPWISVETSYEYIVLVNQPFCLQLQIQASL
ncbi:MAG: hypothetical protein JSV76_06750 [Candidatus Bathyarchaeota archaeon]|nr:MAG: hypothetical protein JSV76_06750 [Candidatus Bathyarchaeota archaeon]